MNPVIDISIDDKKWTALKPGVKTLLKSAVQSTLEATQMTEERPELSIVLTNDRAICELNRDYRGKNAPTNVLSFPLIDFTDPNPAPACGALGDIVLAYETIAREAGEQDKSFADHVQHLVIHGTLHLLGYDHENDDDALEMETLEIVILKHLGVKNPYDSNSFVA